MTKPKRILIVGGGSSGWMTAALLGRWLPETEISLVESSDIPIIGVGESTNMSMNYFLAELDLDEKAFMRATNAAFKLAIRFNNFSRPDASFFHPLSGLVARPPVGEKVARPAPSMFQPDADSFFSASEAGDGRTFSPEYFYAYQIDAGLLGQHLKEVCKARYNVKHVVAEVTNVDLSEAGDIACVRTREAGTLTADLYIDCTGFRSLLLSRAIREPFEPSGHLLLNDRAIAARVPYVDRETELVTYTNCTALSAGWVWRIPLWSRIGVGYVYSSAHLTKSSAEEEFREHLGADRVRDLTFNHLEIRVGRHRRAWAGNCVAIGISYGFLEPLESTGLSLTQVSIRDLVSALQSSVSLAHEREMYNRRQRELFDTTRDFILAHYVTTAREDTAYWRQIRNEISLPDTLVAALGDARYRSYQTLMSEQRLYRAQNWDVILSGMGVFGGRSDRPARTHSTTASRRQNHAAFLRDHVHGDAVESVGSVSSARWFPHPTWYPILSENDALA